MQSGLTRTIFAFALGAFLGLACPPAFAEDATLVAKPPDKDLPTLVRRDPACCPKLTPYGDFRLRYEYDWDSHNPSGVLRDDRQRMRVRVRAGLTFEPTKFWKFDVRLRTGDRRSQQSPHLTFWDITDGQKDELAVGLDRYYAQHKRGFWTFWLGRHDLPFWKQNELFWDDDVTALGGSARWERKCKCDTFTAAAGGYTLPDGQWLYSGALFGAQGKWEHNFGGWSLISAAGLYGILGGDDPEYLLNGNGERDYLTAAVNVQAKTKVARRPLAVGVDLYRNLESYDATGSDTFAAMNRDERNAFVFGATWGEV
jgi:hypothetical protein